MGIKAYLDSGKDGISLLPLLVVNFISTLGFSIAIPFLVFLVADFGGNSIVYGILGATYSAFQMIGAPVLGSWSDKIGRRKGLLWSQIGTFLSWCLFIVALTIPLTTIKQIDSSFLGSFKLTLPLLLLFVARAFDGLTGGNISIANAYLADITPNEKRKENYGKMGISLNLGFILGPALAGVLGTTALAEILPVSAAALISFIGVLIILFMLPESIKNLEYRKGKTGSINKVLTQECKDCIDSTSEELKFKDIFKLPNVSFMVLMYFIIFLGFNFFYVAFPVYASQGLGWSVGKLGLFFSMLSLFMIAFQGPALAYLSKRMTEKRLVFFGTILLAICFLLLLSENEFFVFLSSLFFAAGNGLMWPSFSALLSKVAGDKYQGSVQGIAGSSGSLASIIGLILGGFLYSIMGNNVFYIASGIMGLVFLLSFKLPIIED